LADVCEWAFAGESFTIGDEWDGPRLTRPAVTVWKHSIDSRGNPTGFTDSGYMYVQYDGTVWEKGVMLRPSTGEQTAYAEVWRDEAPSEKIAVSLDHVNGPGVGRIVRLGNYVQGITKNPQSGLYTVERWEHGKRTVKIGDDDMPCIDLLDVKTADDVLFSSKFQQWKLIEFDTGKEDAH
jgi:hypothetical protein